MRNKKYQQTPVSIKSIQILFLLGFVLLSVLLPGCSEKEGDQKEKRKKTKTALSIIRNDDCLNCHSIEDKSVGPAYSRIAQKYEADFSTVNRLAKKIIEGGGGLWGGEQMTKHPLLKSNDARIIVRWILSLDDPAANPNPMEKTPGVSLAEAFRAEQTESENGLVIQAYALEELEDSRASGFPEIPPTLTPQHAGVIKTVHFPGPEAFAPLQKGFMLQMTGVITIGQSGKYFFKQVRVGKGRVLLDGAVIISENDWDRETDIDLSPGTYPITIEYLAEQENNVLSFQWITPEDEYYRVIPEEVFTFSLSQKKAEIVS